MNKGKKHHSLLSSEERTAAIERAYLLKGPYSPDIEAKNREIELGRLGGETDPLSEESAPVINFSKLNITGDVEKFPKFKSTFDQQNLGFSK